MAKKRQEEEERKERQEKETDLDWDSFYDNFDNDTTPLHDSRLPVLPNLSGLDNLPGTSHKTVESVGERKRIRQDNEGILIDTNFEHTDSEFPGLTDLEKREMDGFPNPPEGQSVKERAFLLGIDNNRLREKVANTEPGDRLESLEKYLALNKRLFENLKVRES